MPKLHIKEYTHSLAGKRVFIACREGILRDHFSDIISDIKFLTRQGVETTLFHNISNRFANQQHFRELSRRLPSTRIVRVPNETDFYDFVLNFKTFVSKLIFLERKYLIDLNGHKINAITTNRIRRKMGDFSRLTANTNFNSVLERICEKIDHKICERVHILPAGKHSIKNELFTIEGSGTLIANNFVERFYPVASDKDVEMVYRILKMYKRLGFLKPRDKTYIKENRAHFYVTEIDGIIVGCIEEKRIDKETVELGALAISAKFRNQRVGIYTVTAFMDQMRLKGYSKFISLTNNPGLKALYMELGFKLESPPAYRERQNQSPDVTMFYLS